MFRAGAAEHSLIALAATLLLATTSTSVGAQTLSFGPTGTGGSGSWDNATANWYNGLTVPWASGNTAAFGGTAGTVTVNGTVAMGGATFNTTGYGITGGTLTLSGSTPTITTNAGISATVNSVITGSPALVKTGTGTLTIGNGINTYTGGTTVSQGTMVFGGNQALGSGTVTLGDANTGPSNVSLLANFGNFFSAQKIANTIVVSGAGTGTVTIGSTSFNPGSNGTIFTGAMILNRDVTLVSGNADRTSFTGQITGTGNITIAGSRVTFDNSTNNFVGNITISSGSILQTNAANVLPRTATVTILGNGVLRFVNTGDQTIDGLNGSSSAVMTFLAGGPPNLTVGAANGSGNFAGQIQNVISSLTKLGAGTQILSGANTYAGRTTISGGVLSTQLLANGGAASGIGASSSAAANLVLDGGTLRYTGTGAGTDRQFTLATNGGGLDASGSGALNFTNTAAIALSGTGPRSLTLTGSSSSAASTLAAILGDSGGPSSLVKAGTGTWVLTGNNNYTGSTTVSAGTLALSGAGAIANSARVIADGTFDISGVTAASSSIKGLAGSGSATLGSRTLVITAANDTFSGGISGGGAVTITGGTQTLTGDSAYTGGTTISAGTLQIGDGGTSGSIVGNVLNNGVLAFNRSDIFTFDGVVSGSGVVNQIGSGTTILTAVNPFTGGVNVQAGTLAVNGSLAGSAVTVQSGATLAGNGTVGATTLLTGARIAPGNSIGTLTVNGAYAQAAGTTYQVELDPATTSSDLIRVSGTATLASGAGLATVNSTGAPYVAGQRFTILTSTGLTGTYGLGDQVLTPFLTLRDTYDATNAYLTVIQTRTVGGIGTTPNEAEVGRGVDSLPASDPVHAGLLNQASLDAARRALNQISGEIHASAKTALIDESWLLRAAVNDRLRTAFGAVGAAPMATLNYGFTADLAPSAKGPMPTLRSDRLAVWGQGYGYWGRSNGDGNASKLTRSSGGLLIGSDVAVFDTLRFGVLAGYSRSAFDVNARLSSGESDNYHLGLYGGGEWGALSLRTGASYTWHDIETRRAVTAAFIGSTPRADYDAGTAQVFGELGYRVALGQTALGQTALGQLALEPFAGLAYVNLRTDGFAETGGATALTGQSDDTSLGYSTLGLRASTSLDLQGMGLTVRGGLAWRHAFGDVDPKTTLAFAGSSAFTIAGLPIARDAALVEAGLDVAVGRSATLGVSYTGQLAEDTQDHAFKGVLAVRF